LEKTVRAAGGAVRLVKINIDENPQIAQQLRVQSIPAVFAIKDGRPIDGFQGALPESQIKQFVDRLTGDTGAEDAALAVAEGDRALAAGDPGGAAQFYAAALQADPENMAAVAGLARCYIAAGEAEEARSLLDSVPEELRGHAAIQAALTALNYVVADTDPDEIDALKNAVAAAPGDHQKRLDLALALSGRGRFAEAMDQLLDSVARDREWNEGAARAELLKLFEAAGPTSDATKAGRKRLSSILFA
jgi:putative thioredoxin